MVDIYGFTIFGGMAPTGEVGPDELLRRRIQESYERLPKCDNCGELIKFRLLSLDGYDSWSFCSPECVEKYDSVCEVQAD